MPDAQKMAVICQESAALTKAANLASCRRLVRLRPGIPIGLSDHYGITGAASRIVVLR
jgi:hypothetical protein